MMKIVWYGIPTALIVLFFWITINGINQMILRNNNNKFHAMLLGCTYLGSVPDIEHVLYFDCKDNIELHKEIEWVSGTLYK